MIRGLELAPRSGRVFATPAASMSVDAVPPAWKLPKGVNASLWRYAHTPRLAEDEDALLRRPPPLRGRPRGPRRPVPRARAADRPRLRGRPALAPLRAAGVPGHGRRTVAGRCSRPSARKARGEGLAVLGVRANLCDLGCFPDGDVRLRALDVQHAGDDPRARTPRRRRWPRRSASSGPGGRLALHAHNIWLNLRDPQGRRWLLGQLGASCSGGPDVRRPADDLPGHPGDGGPPLPLGRAAPRPPRGRASGSTRSCRSTPSRPGRSPPPGSCPVSGGGLDRLRRGRPDRSSRRLRSGNRAR